MATKFPNSKNLWISNSKLKFVERTKLQPWTNLTIFCFNENEIEEFADDTFVDLVNLETLWIYSNKITDLSEILFRSLTKLKIFDARNNLITYLPPKLFSNNPNLKVVNFSFNSLKKIDIDFSDFKSIKWIVFDGNECIKASYCKIFDCLKSIKQMQGVIDKDC
ncbi:unnamed protein product [Chironomus riparius]|uniref:Uncharacterized protein n=1 Tax=Chironomus riparius TaxID=315576 RepID=A0A9N9WYP0_9DIPT|nr:unnamed protein product [Chironomus riparius]